MYQGTIEVQSEPDKGSSFIITLNESEELYSEINFKSKNHN